MFIAGEVVDEQASSHAASWQRCLRNPLHIVCLVAEIVLF